MSTIAAPAPTAPDAPPTVTWRDAVTPMSRDSRRRWTVCYALLLMLLAASAVDDTFAAERQAGGIPTILFAALLVVFGMLRRGTRRITALDHPDLDERDVVARNSAYRVAFPLLVLVMIAALVLLATSVPDIARTTRVGQDVLSTRHGWYVELPALIDVGLWIGLWAIFLPTGALAWREPDALEAEHDGGRLPEPLRDALLGLVLAGGMAASLIASSDAGVYAFVAALALLGALARRASGQPVMSRARKWRVAAGIVLIAIVIAVVIAIGLVAGSDGGSSITR
jgi:uncharacterized membrane protein YhaH (DUF805 family)